MAWPWHGRGMAVAWPSRVSHMAAAGQVTWQSHGSHMAVRWRPRRTWARAAAARVEAARAAARAAARTAAARVAAEGERVFEGARAFDPRRPHPAGITGRRAVSGRVRPAQRGRQRARAKKEGAAGEEVLVCCPPDSTVGRSAQHLRTFRSCKRFLGVTR